jgi:glucosamine--fructose-6-phosphate aminotransferase (isomerizing)
MAAEMAEQPRRLAALLSRRQDVADLVRDLVPDRLAGTVLVARGSSDHAATYGRYLFEMATRRPVASASPSVLTLYGTEVDFTGYVVVAASQSGRTPEIVDVLGHARRRGGRTIAVTNEADSPLAGVADAVVHLDAGLERAVPATKTVTAQLAAFAMLAQGLGDVGLDDEAAEAIPTTVAALLGDTDPPDSVAAWLAPATRLAVVARGVLYAAAAETALKIEETTALFASSFSAADLRHGPIAVASTGIPVLALVHHGPARADVTDLVADLRRRGADLCVAGDGDGSELPWPASTPETLAPIPAVVRAQQLAYALALRRGVDPDAPAGLTKVTIT